jgi:hypothetical protein
MSKKSTQSDSRYDAYPNLEASSGSSDESEDRRSVKSHKSLFDATCAQEDVAYTPSRDLLQNAAAVHWGRAQSQIETGTSVSAPGVRRSREKWRQIARLSRRDALQHAEENSILEDSEDDHEEDVPSKGTRTIKRTRGRKVSEKEQNLLAEAARKLTLNQMSRNNAVAASSARTAASFRRTNNIKLHVYDLISQDTLMQLPWGCVCEIGKCFNEVNSALHELGTGAYHVGVEVNGVEFAYGSTSTPRKSGIFSCIPKLSPGYQYRTTIDFGERALRRKRWILVPKKDSNGRQSSCFRQIEECVDGRQVIKEMQWDYMGMDYDVLRKNCCTFARDACIRLGIHNDEIPSWFGNLAESGALTSDLAAATVEPFARVLSSPTAVPVKPAIEYEVARSDVGSDGGFELVAERNEAGTKDLVYVIDIGPTHTQSEIGYPSVRRMSTWNY